MNQNINCQAISDCRSHWVIEAKFDIDSNWCQ